MLVILDPAHPRPVGPPAIPKIDHLHERTRAPGPASAEKKTFGRLLTSRWTIAEGGVGFGDCPRTPSAHPRGGALPGTVRGPGPLDQDGPGPWPSRYSMGEGYGRGALARPSRLADVEGSWARCGGLRKAHEDPPPRARTARGTSSWPRHHSGRSNLEGDAGPFAVPWASKHDPPKAAAAQAHGSPATCRRSSPPGPTGKRAEGRERAPAPNRARDAGAQLGAARTCRARRSSASERG